MGQIEQRVRQKSSPENFPKIRPGSRIFVHGQSAVPYQLLDEVVRRVASVENIEFIHLHTEGTPPHMRPENRSKFRINNLFVSPCLRNSVDCDRIDYTPIFLSEIPKLFKSGRCPIDVA